LTALVAGAEEGAVGLELAAPTSELAVEVAAVVVAEVAASAAGVEGAVEGAGTELAVAVTPLVTGPAALGDDVTVVGAGVAGVVAGAVTVSTVEATEPVRLAVVD
jgi:hypothetical protein